MDPKDILQYYTITDSVNQWIKTNLSQEKESQDGFFIIDCKRCGQNLPYFPAERPLYDCVSVSELNSYLKKQISIKEAICPTCQKPSKEIVQYHNLSFLPKKEEYFLAISEKKEKKGFFSKFSSQIETELFLFWGNTKENTLHLIGEHDERLANLFVDNLYREAEGLFYNKSEYRKVEELLVKCMSIAPDHPPSMILMGRTKLFLSEFTAAEDIFNQVTDRFPDNVRGWLGLSTAQLEMFKLAPSKANLGLVDSAQISVEEGIRIDPKFGEVWNVRGGIHMIKKEFEEAQNCFQKVIGFNPQDPHGRKNSGMAFMAINNFTEAKEIFLKVLNDYPTDEEAAHRLAQCHFELGDKDSGAQVIQEWHHKARKIEWLNELEFQYLSPEEDFDEEETDPN